jgi:LPS sulfotransferase NodH
MIDFFVVGTSRTGSTLLRRMLAAHPAAVVLNESHWVPRLWDTFGASLVPLDQLLAIVAETRWDSGRRVVDVNLDLAGRSWDDLIERLRDRLGTSTSVATFHGTLVDEIFGPTPAGVRRGDKTPDYGYYMSTLAEIWPQARFIHVVRNGLDTACSMARHSGCQLMVSAGYDNWVPLSFGRAHERFQRRELPLDAYIGSWARRMARIRAEATRLRPDSYVEVRYEALIEEPTVVMEHVAGHLGLEPGAEWLSSAADLVRRTPRATDGVEVLRSVNVKDLRALNDVGGVSYLAFPPDAGLEQIEAALARPLDPESTVRVALGVLATRTIESRPALVGRATDRLRDGLRARGEDVAAWAILSSSPIA